MTEPTKYYVFYDGDCGFCNHWVQWILKNDHKDQFRFAALQGEFGQSFLRDRQLKTDHFDTIYLWKPQKFYLTKAAAVTRIAKILGGRFYLLGSLNIFPGFVGDFFYSQVAKRRMKLASQKCFLPTESEKKKFIP